VRHALSLGRCTISL